MVLEDQEIQQQRLTQKYMHSLTNIDSKKQEIDTLQSQITSLNGDIDALKQK